MIEYLSEDRIDYLKQVHANTPISTSHDPNAFVDGTDEIIDHFKIHDPSRGSKYTAWMLNLYKQQKIRQEDGPRLRSALKTFDDHKHKLERRDINQYKELGDLENTVQPYKEVAPTKAGQKQQTIHSGLKTLYDDGVVSTHHLTSKDASIAMYGGGSKGGRPLSTNWCTAADGNNNMFDLYHDPEKGKTLHTIHIEGDEKSPYQISSSGQFMDRDDTPVRYNDVAHRVLDAHVKANGGDNIDALRGHAKSLSALAKIHPMLDPDGENFHEFIRDLSPEIRKSAIIENPHLLTSELSHKLIHEVDDPVLHAVLADHNANRHLSPEDADYLTNTYTSNSSKYSRMGGGAVVSAIARRPDTSVENLSKIVNSPDVSYLSKSAVIRNPNHTKEHLEAVLRSDDQAARASALEHSRHATQEHVDHAFITALPNAAANIVKLSRIKPTPQAWSQKIDNNKEQFGNHVPQYWINSALLRLGARHSDHHRPIVHRDVLTKIMDTIDGYDMPPTLRNHEREEFVEAVNTTPSAFDLTHAHADRIHDWATQSETNKTPVRPLLAIQHTLFNPNSSPDALAKTHSLIRAHRIDVKHPREVVRLLNHKNTPRSVVEDVAKNGTGYHKTHANQILRDKYQS